MLKEKRSQNLESGIYPSKVESTCRKAQWFSHIQLCDPTDVAYQAPLSMGFSRQEY